MTTHLDDVNPGGTTTFGEGPAAASTLADRALFLTEGLQPLTCQTCEASVLVRKNSVDHTSIQWTTDPAASCPAYGGPSWSGCSRLNDSITTAAKTGKITIRNQEAP